MRAINLGRKSLWSVLLIIFFLPISTFAKVSLQDRLQSLLNTTVAASRTPGAVLLVSSPSLGTITVAAGYADKENKTPMTIDNNFRVASISKTFLTVAILKLIEQGLLKLDDHIETLLPFTLDTSRIPNCNKASIRNLLQMRSGIPNYVKYASYLQLIKKLNGKIWVPEYCIRLVYDDKPHFSPNRSFEYSNTNFLLLQLIVEKLRGGSYANAIETEVLKPLNLQQTFVETKEWTSNHLRTRGYAWTGINVSDVTDLNDGLGLADAGMITTVNDLHAFLKALLQDKTLMQPDSLKNMLDMNDEYGLGIWEERINGEKAYSHNGIASGFQGQYYYFPKERLTIILLTNYFDTDLLINFVPQVHEVVSHELEEQIGN